MFLLRSESYREQYWSPHLIQNTVESDWKSEATKSSLKSLLRAGQECNMLRAETGWQFCVIPHFQKQKGLSENHRFAPRRLNRGEKESFLMLGKQLYLPRTGHSLYAERLAIRQTEALPVNEQLNFTENFIFYSGKPTSNRKTNLYFTVFISCPVKFFSFHWQRARLRFLWILKTILWNQQWVQIKTLWLKAVS